MSILLSEPTDAIMKLFEPLDHHLGAQAVSLGRIPGKVLVDDPANPMAAVTWIKHRVYLAGKPTAEFKIDVQRLLTDTIFPEARQAGRERYILYYTCNDWPEASQALLEGLEVAYEWRLYFEYRQAQVDWGQMIPPNMVMQQIDSRLLNSRGLIGRNQIVQALTAEGSSIEDALKRQFGLCLLHRRLIVARCLSEYNGDGRCEFGIITHPDYRRQGLATIVAAALADRAPLFGVSRIGWHCWEKNRASALLAQKVGFEQVIRYPVVTGHL